jgi:hypothetical protein
MSLPHEAFWETPLPPEEFARREAAGEAALAGPEGEEMRAAIAWFVRRYPTPIARIAYIRRKTREAALLQGRLVVAAPPETSG